MTIGTLPVLDDFQQDFCEGMSELSPISAKTGSKRNHSSTSNESDSSIIVENDCNKQQRKRMNTVVEGSDMAVQAALDNISRRLDTLATKADVKQMRDEDFH